MNKELLSVVIPCLEINYLRPCIDALYNNAGYPIDELVIVTDKPSWIMWNYLVYLNERYKARIIINPERVGILKSFNQGFKACSNDLILLLCEDIVIYPDAIKILVDEYLRHPEYGCITGTQVNHPDYTFTFVFSLHRKKILEKIDYLDEYFSPKMCDDNDYIVKLWVHGYNPHSCSDALVYHQPHKIMRMKIEERIKLENIQKTKFWNKWKINKWNWLLMPRHKYKEPCNCKLEDIVKRVTTNSLAQIKKRWKEIGCKNIGQEK